MPHQCTSCGHVFADGSKEMLSGCPDCGGTKFQFHPEGTDIPDQPDPGAEPPDPPTPDDSVTGAVGNAAATVKDLVGRSGSGEATADPTDKATVDPTDNGSPARAETSSPSPDTASASPDTASTSPDSSSENVGGVALETDASASTDTEPTDPASGIEPERATAETRTESAPPTDSAEITAKTASDEDSAQASARTDVVSPDELPNGSGTSADGTDAPETTVEPDTPEPDTRSDAPETGASAAGAEGATAQGTGAEPSDSPSTPDASDSAAEDDRPDLSELRKELNEQFESIKVVEPGQYELNLMELYDREEYIIALEEDGKYSIQVPDRWQD